MKWREWFKSNKQKDMEKIQSMLVALRESNSAFPQSSSKNPYTHTNFSDGKITIVHQGTKKAWQIQLHEIDYDEKAPWA